MNEFKPKNSMDFNKLWEDHIKTLKGKTIYTAAENKKNIIKEVTDDYLIRISSKNIQSPKIPKSLFAEIYVRLRKEGTITRKQINTEYKGRRSSIVTVILERLPGVKVEVGPVRLVYTQSK